jgi:ketosteroid isomerase-like protein
MKFARGHRFQVPVLVACMGFLAYSAHAAGPKVAIEAANAQFAALAAKGDGAGLATLYATDGQILPPGSDVVRGTEAIQKFWQGALHSGIAAVELKTLEVFDAGPTATEVGRYELRDKAGKVLDHGKYIVVWRHEGASWKLLRDMFSSSVPPPKK